MKYYPIHTHLHCSHEPTASIGSHMSHAKSLGIRHIWLTEHDTRMGKKEVDLPVFRFNEKSLFVTLENGAQAGFSEESGSQGRYSFEETKRGVILRVVSEENTEESLLFSAKGKAHADALFSRLSVELEAEITGDATIEFILSAQPSTYEQAKLCYITGNCKKQKYGPVAYLPLPKKENGRYIFNLSQDAGEEIGGLDNALCNLRLRVQNGGEIIFSSLIFRRELNFEEVRQEQIKVAKKLGEKWGVTPFVGFEITGAGNHKNCFSTKVPVIDYAKANYQVSNEQAIAHVKKYGGIFSWNHPFNIFKYSMLPKEEIFELVCNDLVTTRVHGATLIEVGFPFGRDGFTAQDYLRLFDRLSQNGIFITGIGDSDNHHAVDEGWTTGNNFCTFAGLYDCEEATEENFVKAFQRGSVWAGNPVHVKEFVLQANGKEQGSVINGKNVSLTFFAECVCDGYAVCIINGVRNEKIPFSNGCVRGTFTVENVQEYNFGRVELYDNGGRLIAFSNPIYLTDNEQGREI